MVNTKISPAISKKRRSRTRASKAMLGDFIVQFENSMDSLRDTILYLLERNGMKNREYGMILLHDSTALNLKSYYLGFIKKVFESSSNKNDNSQKYLSKLIDKIEDATRLRNMVLHSTWDFIPNLDNYKADLLSGQRYKVNKKDGLHNFFAKLPSRSEFLTFNKSLKLLYQTLEKVRLNLREGNAIEYKNTNLDLVVFNWNGSDFPYRDIGSPEGLY
ncbi:MAG: hypothetical protein EYC69_10015 [Bacteroidetes bacterium]|nr:MAG: hypothetical protein EYC69_10015 [Bacteroidota bacterium]